MRLRLRQAHHTLAQPHIVVGDVEQRGRRIGLAAVARGRHLVGRALGEQGEPFLDPPLVEQLGFELQASDFAVAAEAERWKTTGMAAGAQARSSRTQCDRMVAGATTNEGPEAQRPRMSALRRTQT